jgi:hypothetical protein
MSSLEFFTKKIIKKTSNLRFFFFILKIPKKTRTAMCSSKILNFFKTTETRDSLILEKFENLEPEV